jgi:hypothetical protein
MASDRIYGICRIMVPAVAWKADTLQAPAAHGATEISCRETAELFPAIFRIAGNNPENPVDPVGHFFPFEIKGISNFY